MKRLERTGNAICAPGCRAGPSARLKRRLFFFSDKPLPAEEKEPSPNLSFSAWLPPATAALLLPVRSCLNQPQQPGNILRPAAQLQLVAIALSKPKALPPWLPGSFFPAEHNGLPSSTFEWTNGNGFKFRALVHVPFSNGTN